MSLWAIIPVKPLNRAKSRLSSVLSPTQRAQLAETMMRRMLTVLVDTPRITGTIVISRDSKALSIARELGAKTVQENGQSELNPALARATEVVRAWGGHAVLILPADLPFITSEDITNIIELGEYTLTVVIATDANQDGTNALLVRPAGLMTYAYGSGSYHRHLTIAKYAGAEIKTYQSDTISLDIDTPADLVEYNRRVTAQSIQDLDVFTLDELVEE